MEGSCRFNTSIQDLSNVLSLLEASHVGRLLYSSTEPWTINPSNVGVENYNPDCFFSLDDYHETLKPINLHPLSICSSGGCHVWRIASSEALTLKKASKQGKLSFTWSFGNRRTEVSCMWTTSISLMTNGKHSLIEGYVTVEREGVSLRYPRKPLLIATLNLRREICEHTFLIELEWPCPRIHTH